MKRILSVILFGMLFLVSCQEKEESSVVKKTSESAPSAVTLTLEGSGN